MDHTQPRWLKKIGNISAAYDADEDVLKFLLEPFPIVFGLAAKEWEQSSEVQTKERTSSNTMEFMITNRGFNRAANSSGDGGYDHAAQVIAHVVRDWTNKGTHLRATLYSWCIRQVLQHQRNKTRAVLIPGAGLGRLAYDLGTYDYTVEANDASVCMAAAAHKLWHWNRTSAGNRTMKLHPYVLDYLVNEIDPKKRYDTVHFPDNHPSTQRRLNLSYTVGSFVEIYASPSLKSYYGSVVTCFFVDTASNIYEYALLIWHLLEEESGIWVNVGPLQWHSNAQLHPSAEELRRILETLGFDILHWSIDTKPVPYRNDLETSVRYTKDEAYLPLRFVAKKRPGFKLDAMSCLRRMKQRVISDAKERPDLDINMPGPLIHEIK